MVNAFGNGLQASEKNYDLIYKIVICRVDSKKQRQKTLYICGPLKIKVATPTPQFLHEPS